MSDFLWSGGAPRAQLQLLHQPWKGGLTVPNFSRYFLAGQLVFVHRWLTQRRDDAAVSQEAAVVGSYEALSHLVFRGSKAPYPLTLAQQS